jgi:hypothetical protein
MKILERSTDIDAPGEVAWTILVPRWCQLAG